MNELLSRISGMELNTMHVVSIVIFGIYILASGIGFAVSFMMGRGYLDLARGLRKILERQDKNGQLGDIVELTDEIRKYYNSYAKVNPSVKQRYSGIVSWMDDILLQTNVLTNSRRKSKRSIWVSFEEYYDTLMEVHRYLESCEPFYRCTSSQAQMLEDIARLSRQDSEAPVAAVVKKVEAEFIRLNNDGKKNERTNYISIAIGVAGILVSVLLTVLQMFE